MVEAARLKSLFDALDALPEGVTGEILHDQLHAHPRPALRHVLAASRLGVTIGSRYDRGRQGQGGWWIIDEPELHLPPDARVIVPDLAGWRRERLPQFPDTQRCDVAPDWICEVLSPATRSKDREIKMPLYARHGVCHGWLVDPEASTLEAYVLRDGALLCAATFGAQDMVEAAPFEAAGFRVAELWS